MYRRILVATDGSQPSKAAAGSALQLARALGAEVLAVHISKPYQAAVTLAGFDIMPARDEYERLCDESAAAILGEVEKEAIGLGVPCQTGHLSEDNAWEAIVRTALDRNCDLIHMGSHGKSGLTALILGSQAQKVLTHSKIPVLVYR